MDIFEQYFDKQLEYTYYKYQDKQWYDKGIDSLVLNKDMMPYYVAEMIETEPDDWLYLPVQNKEGLRHRFLDSQADYLFYFKKHTSKLLTGEPSAVRSKIIELWQSENAKYKNMALIELATGFQYVAFPVHEFDEILTEHELQPAVIHLLKNYGDLTDKS